MWSDKVSLKFASQALPIRLGLQNGHTFDAVVLGTFTHEDGTPSAGWHVDCRYVGTLPEALEPYVINPVNSRHEYV